LAVTCKEQLGLSQCSQNPQSEPSAININPAHTLTPVRSF